MLQRPNSVPSVSLVTTWTEAAESDFYCVEPLARRLMRFLTAWACRWLQPGKTEVGCFAHQRVGKLD